MELFWQGMSEGFRLLLSLDPELMRIVALSLAVSSAATALSALLGIPLGVLLASSRFPGRRLAEVLVNTGMGLPPVFVGLLVTMLLFRSGPLGFLDLLYTPWAMIAAQLTVALPLAAGLTRGAIAGLDPDLVSALRVDGASGIALWRELIRAAGGPIVLAVVASFGRAISEVGASLMVGGNILGQTRVLTTAIALENSKGEFALAIALGTVLLVLAFLANAAVHRTAGKLVEPL